MSFNDFDMTGFYNVLKEFKTEQKNKVIRLYGSIDKFNEMIEKIKSVESDIAKMAVKQYGSTKKYAEIVKKNLNNNLSITNAEQIDKFKKDCLYDKNPKLKELYKNLTADLSKDPYSIEIQQIAGKITTEAKKDYEIFRTNMGDYYWYTMVRLYLILPQWIEKVDKKYGNGASEFIGKSLKIYLGDYEPKLETLYKKLTTDLDKSPSSDEVQQIVSEIIIGTQELNESLNMEVGDNYWSYIAYKYTSDPVLIKSFDNKYGCGSSKFIGEAIKFHTEN